MRRPIYARWQWPSDHGERHYRTVDCGGEFFHYTSLGPTTGATVRKLAALKPKVLATMHGSSFSGDGATALSALGDHHDVLLRTALADRKLS